MVLSNKWVKNEIREEIKKFLEQTKMNSTIQNLWDTAKVVLTGNSNAALPKKNRNISSKQLNPTPTRT